MFRRIGLCVATVTAVSMVALPRPSAYAATNGTVRTVAPGVLRRIQHSCWGCLALTPKHIARAGQHRLVRTAHPVKHRQTARRVHTVTPRTGIHARRPSVRRPVSPVVLTSGTRVLRGTMTSASVIRMTAAFSVGHATSLDWNLPRPTSLALNGFRQTVQSVHFRFTVAPASSTDLMVDGHPVRQFHWNNPPANTVINVVEKLHVVTQSSLSPFKSAAAYPLANVTAAAQPDLTITPLVHLPPAAQRLVRSLARGRVREQGVVESIVNWVASHIHYAYGVSAPAYDATTVFRSHAASCTGYADLTAGMLRTLGIPTQVVFGLISGKAIDLRSTGPRQSIGWGVGSSTGEMHAWLNVYFPDAGWVPLDPQLEKFFIDPRHVAFENNIDAGPSGIGSFSAQAAGAASPTGRTLSNHYVAIAPADGISSQVSVRSRDAFHVQFDGSRPDVKHVLLFSR